MTMSIMRKFKVHLHQVDQNTIETLLPVEVIYPACTARVGVYVIGAGVHINVGRYICLWTKKEFESTLAIDSPFQTFTVGLLVEFIDWLYHCVLQKHFPRRVNQGVSYIMRTLLLLSGWMTQQLPA